MNWSHSQTMIVVFKICKSHLRAFTSTVIKAQITQRGAKSLGRDAFPVFRVISSCSGKQQQAIDQLDSRARGQWRMATLHVGVGLCFTGRGHKIPD